MAARDGTGRARQDHYAVLGVTPSASAAEITSAFRRWVLTVHPDAHPGGPAARERLAEVVAAYAVLRDPEQRASYDAACGRRAPGAPAGARPVRVRRVTDPRPGRTGRPAAAGIRLRVARSAAPDGEGPLRAGAVLRLSLGDRQVNGVLGLLLGFGRGSVREDPWP